MPAYTRNDVRKALALETAVRDMLGALPEADRTPAEAAAHAVSDARVAALRTLLKQVPDDEVIDAFY